MLFRKPDSKNRAEELVAMYKAQLEDIQTKIDQLKKK